jgi:hypothetical protein
MFAIDFGDFLNNPLSFNFNTAKQICLFLTSRDLLNVKPNPKILPPHFFREIEDREKKSTRDATRRN